MPGDEDSNNNFETQVHKKVNTFKDAANDFLKSVTSRLTVAQVVEGVRVSFI